MYFAFGCHPPVRVSPGVVRIPRTPLVTPLKLPTNEVKLISSQAGSALNV